MTTTALITKCAICCTEQILCKNSKTIPFMLFSTKGNSIIPLISILNLLVNEALDDICGFFAKHVFLFLTLV